MAASPLGDYWLKQISATNTLVQVTTNGSDPLDIAGPYKSLAQAEAAAAKVNAEGGAGASLGTVLGQIPTALNAGSQAGPSLTGINAIGDFFGRLTEAQTWERVGLVVVGFMFLGIGIVSVAGNTKTGKTVGKAAAKGVFL